MIWAESEEEAREVDEMVIAVVQKNLPLPGRVQVVEGALPLPLIVGCLLEWEALLSGKRVLKDYDVFDLQTQEAASPTATNTRNTARQPIWLPLGLAQHSEPEPPKTQDQHQ